VLIGVPRKLNESRVGVKLAKRPYRYSVLSSRPGKRPVMSTRPMTSSTSRVELRNLACTTFAGYMRLVMNRSVRLKTSSTVGSGCWHVSLLVGAYLAAVRVERRMSGRSPEVVIFIMEMMKNWVSRVDL
jgi:hypothetical protein